MCYYERPFPQRIRPNKGVLIKDHQPTLVFVTICTKGRKPWLATDANHCLLRTKGAEERRAYMIENPVRAGLVQRACDWPYVGDVFKPGFWW
jgi:hypothetical protein